jgi:fibronectin type 3 domain-containing protein
VTDSRTTSFIDTDLQPSTLYYYRIYVFDTGGNYAASNIVFAATAENSIPQPIILSQPIQDGDDLILTWSPSVEADFANYRLFRSTLVEPDTSYTLIRIINTASTTEFRDVSVVSDIDYYYQIFVFDQFGLSAGSNIVHGRVDSSYNSYLNDLSF